MSYIATCMSLSPQILCSRCPRPPQDILGYPRMSGIATTMSRAQNQSGGTQNLVPEIAWTAQVWCKTYTLHIPMCAPNFEKRESPISLEKYSWVSRCKLEIWGLHHSGSQPFNYISRCYFTPLCTYNVLYSLSFPLSPSLLHSLPLWLSVSRLSLMQRCHCMSCWWQQAWPAWMFPLTPSVQMGGSFGNEDSYCGWPSSTRTGSQLGLAPGKPDVYYVLVHIYMYTVLWTVYMYMKKSKKTQLCTCTCMFIKCTGR